MNTYKIFLYENLHLKHFPKQINGVKSQRECVIRLSI